MNQEILNTISSFTSKVLRKNFGKGPRLCQSTLSDRYLVVYIRGFISPMEEVLIQQGHRNQVEKARTVIINHVIEELKGVVEISINRDVGEYYHDWNLPNNTGIMMFLLDERAGSECMPEEHVNLKLLESEVARISLLVEKVPDQIKIYPLSKSLYVIERKGILVPIEKSLIQKGFADELKMTKDELEKSHFHRNGKFDEIFQTNVKDIFIDWNFKEDKSYMAFILNN
ncbi:Na-translocating system protein MpsC family protein [Metabacillus halosaccharovorans]|uniref:Na-translocating system protein MpsC family protein n=1 Tax=Metabacillus halosaccharovorans TaxID=930124 RepID=UPI00403D5A8C